MAITDMALIDMTLIDMADIRMTGIETTGGAARRLFYTRTANARHLPPDYAAAVSLVSRIWRISVSSCAFRSAGPLPFSNCEAVLIDAR